MSGALGSIDHVESWEQFVASLRDMTDGSLLAQECVQKGAVHALTTLVRAGCTEREAQAMLRDYGLAADAVADECRRRGLRTIRDPRAI